ncbi:S-adenosylmethionine:tRNA ribosyltransferase-isomerase [Puia sp. P3]|uniref:S-adenosylmethionine:tRNA ribosyltransferase-isomerase n=1 Tax=Puia sp. P3 TaxID=3423952 RepID=UPI003D667DB7
MDPKNISIADYSYDLPQENIAFYPLEERDASKLLIYRDGTITESTYRNIGDWLPENSLLVFNNTRVVEARILFQKPTGGQIEIFCLEPPSDYGSVAMAMAQTGKVKWRCLIGGASKWKPGQVLHKELDTPSSPLTLEARFISKEADTFLIELSRSPAGLNFAEVLHQTGLIPLPPYIRRSAEAMDSQRYQTIYARHDGSVAAPTAGLHFTETVFAGLAQRNIRRSWVTLHVGAGTFLPVKTTTLGDHPMHVEFITVEIATIRMLRQTLEDEQPIVPVGTTSARTIESLYWLGIKAQQHPRLAEPELVVRQWDAYELSGQTDPKIALDALLEWMKAREMTELVTTTQLLITPGYEWKIGSGLITNFHQPESTLLLLIASLVGEEWKRIYDYALGRGFRFLSYGDGCLLWRRSNH